jgi:pantoate--beta-alanine ligase
MIDARRAWARAGETVAFVPTMGALHAGHLSLVKQAKDAARRVVVSIFVNPIQFGPSEDFAKYPRTLTQDVELMAPLAVDGVFLPSAATMYPDGFQTYVTNRTMSQGLCGASRPGHFDGVLTVVLKLLNIVAPDVAIFGKKDYQQWRLIEQMARDLALPTTITGGAIVREADGLAMSSRNRYLSDSDRQLAARLNKGLHAARDKYKAGVKQSAELIAAFQQVAVVNGVALEYAEVRRQADLQPFAGEIDAPPVMLVAAKIGTTRLIDNLELDQP